MVGACKFASDSILDASSESGFVDSMKRVGGRVWDDGKTVAYTERPISHVIGATVGVGAAILIIPGALALIGGLALMSAALDDKPKKKKKNKKGKAGGCHKRAANRGTDNPSDG